MILLAGDLQASSQFAETFLGLQRCVLEDCFSCRLSQQRCLLATAPCHQKSPAADCGPAWQAVGQEWRCRVGLPGKGLPGRAQAGSKPNSPLLNRHRPLPAPDQNPLPPRLRFPSLLSLVFQDTDTASVLNPLNMEHGVQSVLPRPI